MDALIRWFPVHANILGLRWNILVYTNNVKVLWLERYPVPLSFTAGILPSTPIAGDKASDVRDAILSREQKNWRNSACVRCWELELLLLSYSNPCGSLKHPPLLTDNWAVVLTEAWYDRKQVFRWPKLDKSLFTLSFNLNRYFRPKGSHNLF